MKLVQTWGQFSVTGKDDHSLEELPDEVRQLLEQHQGPGLLDALRRVAASQGGFSFEMKTVNGITTYKVGEHEYRSLDELPPEYRTLLSDRDPDGLARFLQQMARPNPGALAEEAGCLTWQGGVPGVTRSAPGDSSSPPPMPATGRWRKFVVPALVWLLLAALAIAYALGHG